MITKRESNLNKLRRLRMVRERAGEETDRLTNEDIEELKKMRKARPDYTTEELKKMRMARPDYSGMKYGGMKKKTKKMKHGGMHKKKKVMKANKGISVDFPLDHPDTERLYKFSKEKSAENKKKFPKMSAIFSALGLQGEKKITKERSAKFLGEMARNRAKRLTATEGSFKTGGMSKARGTGCAIRGTNFKGIF